MSTGLAQVQNSSIPQLSYPNFMLSKLVRIQGIVYEHLPRMIRTPFNYEIMFAVTIALSPIIGISLLVMDTSLKIATIAILIFGFLQPIIMAILEQETSKELSYKFSGAIREHDLKQINFLVSAGAILDKSNLIDAVKTKNLEIVREVLRLKPDLYQDSGDPLVLAAGLNQKEMVELLLVPGSNCQLRDTEGMTVFTYAAKYGHASLVKRLAEEFKVDVNQVTRRGITALMLAAQQGRVETVKILLALKADRNLFPADGGTALIRAAHGGHTEIVRLLANKENVDQAPTTGEKCGFTPLMAATQTGHTTTAFELLKLGAKINLWDLTQGMTPIMWAASEDHHETVSMLTANGVEVDQSPKGGPKAGSTALMVATAFGNTQTARILLELKANPNLQDQEGMTALMRAADGGDLPTVQLLLGKKASVALKANNGCTVLVCAAQRGNVEIAQLMIEEGAHVDEPLIQGITPLMCAAGNGHHEMIRALVTLGADVLKEDKGGMTALKHAAKNRQMNAIWVLEGLESKARRVRPSGY